MRYKNLKTGAVISTACAIIGGDWEPIGKPERIILVKPAEQAEEPVKPAAKKEKKSGTVAQAEPEPDEADTFDFTPAARPSKKAAAKTDPKKTAAKAKGRKK